MATATELRRQLTAKVQAMPTGMLIQAAETMDAKPNRDEAESRVMVELAVELSRRLRDMAREHTSEALLLDLIDMMKADDRAYVKQKTFQAVGDVLEERFPVATEAAGEWLDAADFEKCNPDGYDYHRELVLKITALQA
jgi:hypothetical protein